MKPIIFRSSLFIASIFLLSSMTNSTIKNKKPTTQKEFNDFFSKRSLVISSIAELESRYNTKFNFFQKFKINQAKKKISKQLKKENLSDECDSIKLKNGEVITALVSEVTTSEIKYKKCENKTGPTYSLNKSDIAMIRYANGSKDFFGNERPAGTNKNDEVNSADAKMDPLAIASILSVSAGITSMLVAILASSSTPVFWVGLGLVTAGIALGFASKNKIKRSEGKLKGEGLAIGGIAAGFTAIGLVVIAVIIAVSVSW